jgi:hypothetical protein
MGYLPPFAIPFTISLGTGWYYTNIFYINKYQHDLNFYTAFDRTIYINNTSN